MSNGRSCAQNVARRQAEVLDHGSGRGVCGDPLVLVQAGWFLGLLDNATVTIENAPTDIWVTSKVTPNIDLESV
jgi:hypothetical protein